MNKFKFRLQKVKNSKNEKVKQKNQQLHELHFRQENLRKKMHNLQNEMSVLQKTNLLRTVEGPMVKDLVNSQKQIKKLINEIKIVNEEHESIDGQIEELHVSMLKFDQEKNILEKLKEKRHLQYFQEQNKEEQELLEKMHLLTKDMKKLL